MRRSKDRFRIGGKEIKKKVLRFKVSSRRRRVPAVRQDMPMDGHAIGSDGVLAHASFVTLPR